MPLERSDVKEGSLLRPKGSDDVFLVTKIEDKDQKMMVRNITKHCESEIAFRDVFSPPQGQRPYTLLDPEDGQRIISNEIERRLAKRDRALDDFYHAEACLRDCKHSAWLAALYREQDATKEAV